MSTKVIIEFLNSNMFLIVSYSLIFILLSGYALRFIAKLFMFFVYIGIFVFAMSFMFSSTPGFDMGNLSFDKAINGIASSINDLKSVINQSRNAVGNFSSMVDMNKVSNAISTGKNQLQQVTEQAKNKINQYSSSTPSVSSDVYQSSSEIGEPVKIQVNPSSQSSNSLFRTFNY